MKTNPRTQARRRPAAFTLIELLTVIAIIGILAAIIVPVVGKVRQSARQSACASNLRQVGVAIQAFAAEHQNWLPGGYQTSGKWNLYGLQRAAGPQGWVESGIPTQDLAAQLYPYLRESLTGKNGALPVLDILVCRANSVAVDSIETSPIASYYLGTGVELTNGQLVRPFGKASGTRPPRLNAIANPSKSVALFDLDLAIITNLGELVGGAVSPNSPATSDDVHGNTRNFLYLDGHVAALPSDYLPPRAP